MGTGKVPLYPLLHSSDGSVSEKSRPTAAKRTEGGSGRWKGGRDLWKREQKPRKYAKGLEPGGLTHLPAELRAPAGVRAGITEGRVRSGAGTGRASEAPSANTSSSFHQVTNAARHLPTPGKKISFFSKDN